MNELLAACGAWVWVYVLRVHHLIKWMNRKPFACEVCMAGWFTLFMYWINWMTPFRMAAAMIITIILTKAMNKI